MQKRGRLGNGQEQHQSTGGVWRNTQVTGDVRVMGFITQSGKAADCGSKAHPQNKLNVGNFTLKCPCIPSVLLEASIWEHPSVRASMVEAVRGFGASVAMLELKMVVCVGTEVAGGIGPSEMLLPLLPSWPAGGASATTDEQQQCCKYCRF